MSPTNSSDLPTAISPCELDALSRLSVLLQLPLTHLSPTYSSLHRNVRSVLRRQWDPLILSTGDTADCCSAIEFRAEDEFLQGLGSAALRSEDSHRIAERLLLVLARVFDAAYLAVCKERERRQRKGESKVTETTAIVHLRDLAEGMLSGSFSVEDRVVIETAKEEDLIFVAHWEHVSKLDFSDLSILGSLGNLLPGEQPMSMSMSDGQKWQTQIQNYAGIGGGGGSDIISASLLGHLLRGAGKEMDLLISTRTWLTGSQGGPGSGSKIGEKREIFDHAGHITDEEDNHVPGVYRVKKETYTSGRDLETIPLSKHKSLFIALDPGPAPAEPTSSNPHLALSSPAPLPTQYQAIISQHTTPIQTLLTVDTGGDVFLPSPDSQDFQVQSCLSSLSPDTYPSLTTAILCPGVDAPPSSVTTAQRANALRYIPTQAEKTQMLHLLAEEYHMDGRDETRFGKTNLCLQHALKGQFGWQVLDLPRHVVETGRNPWGIFEWVSPGMAEIIFVGTRVLVRTLRETLEEGEKRE